MENQKKTHAETIYLALKETIFNKESEHYIKLKEQGDLNRFMHALANEVPALFLFEVTDEAITALEMNHRANILCFQFGKSK